MENIDKDHYLKQKNRVKNQKQRDELRGEYKVIYFVSKILKLLITRIDPNYNNKQDYINN